MCSFAFWDLTDKKSLSEVLNSHNRLSEWPFAPAFALWYSHGSELHSKYDTISRGIKIVNMDFVPDLKTHTQKKNNNKAKPKQ